MEIIPGVHRFKAPLRGSTLAYINIYLLEGPAGSLLIDTGWKEAGVWEDLLSQFAADGIKAEDITDVVITHVHLDHCGLASEFKRLSGARRWAHARRRPSCEGTTTRPCWTTWGMVDRDGVTGPEPVSSMRLRA